MSKVLLHTRLSGLVVHLSWKNKFPECKKEDRKYYRHGFRRLTITNRPDHIFFPSRGRYFDLVSVSDYWNVKVKERNSPHLLPIDDKLDIILIKQSYLTAEQGIVETISLIFEEKNKREQLTVNIGINSGDFSKSIV